MGRRTMAAAIIYRQMLPSSAFFALFPACYLRNPGPLRCLRPFDRGIEILGLLIYTYETKPGLRRSYEIWGENCAEKKGHTECRALGVQNN